MAKLDKHKLLLLKEESQEGVDSVPTGSDVLLIEELTTTPEQETVEAPPVAASNSKEFSSPTRTRVKSTVKMRLRGSGEVPNTLGGASPTRPPSGGPLLEAASCRRTNATILYFQSGLTASIPFGTLIFGAHSRAVGRVLVVNQASELYLIIESLNNESFAPNEPVLRDTVNTGTQIGTTAYTPGNQNVIFEAGFG